MKLSELLKNITYKGHYDDTEISYITYDSRKVKKNSLFIAVNGQNFNGHDYINEAIENGASAIIANGQSQPSNKIPIIHVENTRKTMSRIAANFFGNPSKKLKIIGITGTNGKTTTTEIIDHIIKFSRRESSSLGTLGFNSPSGIVSTGFTTPESIELQHILKTIKDGGGKYVPMEISSHAIELHRTSDVNIDIGIFTNLGYDHLDFHKSQENYFNSKLKLFTRLNKKSIAILNLDDDRSNSIIKRIKCQYFTYGFNEKSDFRIIEFSMDLNKTKVLFSINKKKVLLETNLIGKFNLSNLAAAILCTIKLNIPIEIIIESIKHFKNVPGRLEKYKFKNNIIIIDYAHTPDAFSNIYENIDEFKGNRKIISIFGCGGNRDKTKRPKMAKICENYSSFTYITNDNPRYENEDQIISDICKGFNKQSYKIIKDRKNAIEEAVLKNNNAIILILGKGIEEYQIIKGEKISYSDIKTIKDLIYEN